MLCWATALVIKCYNGHRKWAHQPTFSAHSVSLCIRYCAKRFTKMNSFNPEDVL